VMIIDKDSSQRTLKAAIDAARSKGLPAVVSLGAGGKVVATVPLPADYAKFKEVFSD